jgi:pyruvate/2-oxoglutarate dehydrogenase complex dihydrolipoamide acyltransferase (E2) component
VIPHGSATALLSIGSIIEKDDRRNFCLTASFDHDVVGGAPAAQFTGDLIGEFESAKCVPGLETP